MRIPNFLKNLLLLLVSISLAFLLAEGLARLLLPAPPRIVSLQKDEKAQQRLAQENQEYREMPLLEHMEYTGALVVNTPTGRRLRANSHVKMINHNLSQRDIEFRTNALGYRNREIGPKQLTRVLFLGDSITLADYVEDEETFVKQVELLSWETQTPVETINAGVGGASLTNELAVLEETGLSTKPDVVVLGFYLNDFNESAAFHVGRLPGWLNQSYVVWLVVKSFSLVKIEMEERGRFGPRSLPQLKEEIQEHWKPEAGDPLQSRSAFYQEVEKTIMDWGSAWSTSLWDYMTPTFFHFRQLADTHGFQPMIMVLPVKLQVEAEFIEDFPQQQVKAIGKQLGIPVLDVLPFLREVAKTESAPLFYDHCHPTPLGNQLVAENIWTFLQDNVSLSKASQVPEDLRNTVSEQAKAFPSRVAMYFQRAYHNFQQDNYDQAERDLERSLSLQPTVQSHNLLGLVYMQQGFAEKALSNFEQALKIEPDNIHVLNNRGILFHDFYQDVSKACADLTIACVQNQCSAEALTLFQQKCVP